MTNRELLLTFTSSINSIQKKQKMKNLIKNTIISQALTDHKQNSYDVIFNDDDNSNSKGFELSLEDAKEYIAKYNGTNESYFADYKGGMVSIVNNQTGETVYEENII